MNNSTDATKALRKVDNFWILFQLATALYLTVATYIFAALVRYEVINGKFKGPYLIPGFVMKLTAMISSLCVIVSSVTTQVTLLAHIGSIDSGLFICKTSFRLCALSVCLGLTSAYLFLWCRQYSFYKRNSFRDFNFKIIHLFSNAAMVSIVPMLVTSVAVFSTANVSTFSTERGCTYFGLNKWVLRFTRLVSVFRLAATAALFSLFLFPLVIKYGRTICGRATDIDNDEISEIKRAIRVSLISVTACLLSDCVVIVIVNVLLVAKVPSFYVNSLNELSLLVNVIALVFTYDRSGDILFGCFRRRP